MSFRTMLKHRAKVLELKEAQLNGYSTHMWQTVQVQARSPESNAPVVDGAGKPVMVDLVVPCFLDLNFIRKGKDPIWTPESGRASDRTGVAFFPGDAPIKTSTRIKMVKGPEGTFMIEMAVDEAWKPDSRHHLEVGVTEVAQQLAKGAPGAG